MSSPYSFFHSPSSTFESGLLSDASFTNDIDEETAAWWDDDEFFNPHYKSPSRSPSPSALSTPDRATTPSGFVTSNEGRQSGKQVFGFKIFDTTRPDEVNWALAEVKALKRMKQHTPSPYMHEAYVADQDLTRMIMIMPFVQRTLACQIGQPDNLAKYIYQTALGLAALHDIGIIHRDIRPDNLLLTADGDIRITNFHRAYVHPTGRMRRGQVKLVGSMGTAEYLSPEAIEGPYDHAVDYWALGVTMFQLLTGKVPFEYSTSVFEYCATEKLSYQYWVKNEGFSECEAEVIYTLLHPKPQRRFHATIHPYFDSVAESPLSGHRHYALTTGCECISCSRLPIVSTGEDTVGRSIFAFDPVSFRQALVTYLRASFDAPRLPIDTHLKYHPPSRPPYNTSLIIIARYVWERCRTLPFRLAPMSRFVSLSPMYRLAPYPA